MWTQDRASVARDDLLIPLTGTICNTNDPTLIWHCKACLKRLPEDGARIAKAEGKGEDKGGAEHMTIGVSFEHLHFSVTDLQL